MSGSGNNLSLFTFSDDASPEFDNVAINLQAELRSQWMRFLSTGEYRTECLLLVLRFRLLLCLASSLALLLAALCLHIIYFCTDNIVVIIGSDVYPVMFILINILKATKSKETDIWSFEQKWLRF